MTTTESYPHFSKLEIETWRNRGESLNTSGLDLQLPESFADSISHTDFESIYRPLAFHIHSLIEQERQEMQELLLPKPETAIISVTGSVAVGKSTSAKLIQRLLSQFPAHQQVELVETDGFLFPNATLAEKGLLERKGFPDSFDNKKLLQFLQDIKSGEANLEVPIHSHEVYDILPDKFQVVDRPDILMIEGINTLQANVSEAGQATHPSFSDFFDFSIYVDAEREHIYQWFLKRLMGHLEEARRDETSFYRQFAHLTDTEAEALAKSVWQDINEKNLIEHIEPTRERADLILKKGVDHSVEGIYLKP